MRIFFALGVLRRKEEVKTITGEIIFLRERLRCRIELYERPEQYYHCPPQMNKRIEKLSVLVIIAASCFASSGYSKANLHASERACANIKFHNLNRYKYNWSGVFRDREVAPFLRRLLKNDYRLLISSLKSVSYPEDSLSFVDQKGVLTLRGFVPGLGTIMEAMLVVEPCGNIYVGILDSDRFLYFSNDKEYIEQLSPVIEQWRTGIEQLRSQFEKKPELPVVFKSK